MKLTEKKLILATHNQGKIKEFEALLAPYGIEIASAQGYPEPVEDGDTFTQNALIKARALAKASGLPALADDSGLCVHALNDRPGIYSARYNDPKKNGFAYAMKCLNDELSDAKDRTAHYTCALALVKPDGQEEVFEGRIDGTLVYPVQEGTHGFGYDPMFVPDGYDRSFAQLPDELKNGISHRARAIALFVKECLS